MENNTYNFGEHTLYNKEKALSFAVIKHERDNKLKGYKLKITGTINLFKNATNIYVEKGELLEILKFILNKKEKTENYKIYRNASISGSNKSLSISYYNGNLQFGVSNSEFGPSHNFFISLSEWDKFILKNLIEKTILLDVYSTNKIQLTKDDLIF